MSIYANAKKLAEKIQRGISFVEGKERILVCTKSYQVSTELWPMIYEPKYLETDITTNTYVLESVVDKLKLGRDRFQIVTDFPKVSDDIKFLMGILGFFSITGIEINHSFDVNEVMVIASIMKDHSFAEGIQGILNKEYQRVVPIFSVPDFNGNLSLIFMNKLVSSKTLDDSVYLLGDSTENIRAIMQYYDLFDSYVHAQEVLSSPESYLRDQNFDDESKILN